MTLKLFVCKICGEPYLGENSPSECPFCGAPEKMMGMAEDYSVLWGIELTEQEKTDMEKTLALEVNAVAYYDKVANAQEKYSKYNRLFKQLTRVEKEHAEVAAKFLGIELPEFKGEDLKENLDKDIERTKELEKNAVKEYKAFLENASSDKVKMFYTALIHAEQGHFEFISESK